ncbi:MAG: hypothetical protein ACRD3R_09735, partial [Terriglobales bacterium]
RTYIAHAQGRAPPAHRVSFGALTRPGAGHAGTTKGGLAVTKGKFLLIVLIAALVAAFIAFDFGQYFSLPYLK